MSETHRPESLPRVTENISETRRDALVGLIPEAFVGGVLDADALAAAIGETRTSPGGYQLTWSSKPKAQAAAGQPTPATLVPDRDQSVRFEEARHVVVEGDNLLVLKTLQTAYTGQAKLIYIDPPYNTGGQFTYDDDYSDALGHYLQQTGQGDESGRRFSTATDAGGQLHDRWLTMIYPRLQLARNLLRQDGFIAVSIDDNEVHNLRLLMDELYGPQNFVAQLIWKKKSGGGGDVAQIVADHEYILVYGRGGDARVYPDRNAKVATNYNRTDEEGRRYAQERLDKANLDYVASMDFPISGPDGREYVVEHDDPESKRRRWRWSREKVAKEYHKLDFANGHVYTRNYEKLEGARPRSLLVDKRFGRTRTGTTDLKRLFGAEVHEFPKPVRLLEHLISIFTREDDLVIDFFAGSGTTGEAVLAANKADKGSRRFLLVQYPVPIPPHRAAYKAGLRTIADTCRARVRLALEERGLEGGFRAFRLDAGGLQSWEVPAGASGDQLQEALPGAINRAEPGRSREALAHELALRAGRRLDLALSPIPGLGDASWMVDGLLICLEPTFSDELADLICGLRPRRLIALDAAFAGRDALLLNLARRLDEVRCSNFQTV